MPNIRHTPARRDRSQELSPCGSKIRCGQCSEWSELRWQAAVYVGSTAVAVDRGAFNAAGIWESVTVNVRRPVTRKLYVCRACYGASKNAANVRPGQSHLSAPSVTVGQAKRDLREADRDAEVSQAQDNALFRAYMNLRETPGRPAKRGMVVFPSSGLLKRTNAPCGDCGQADCPDCFGE